MALKKRKGGKKAGKGGKSAGKARVVARKPRMAKKLKVDLVQLEAVVNTQVKNSK